MGTLELHPIMAGAIPSVILLVGILHRYLMDSLKEDVRKKVLPLVVLLGVVIFAMIFLPIDLGWRVISGNVVVGWIMVMGTFSGGKALMGKS